MKIVAYTVAPLVHYAPFFRALADLKQGKAGEVSVRFCRTDRNVIDRACKASKSSRSGTEDQISLALTSITDLGSTKVGSKAAQHLKLLFPLIPRIPLWYVCLKDRHEELSAAFQKLTTETSKASLPKFKIACYAKNTTSYWVVFHSFPKGSISFDKRPLSFREDRVSLARFKEKRIDFAVTLHPWRYTKVNEDDLLLLDGPSVAPFGFTAVLFHKQAIEVPELRDGLRQIREAIHKQIIQLYKCLELPRFDWRRQIHGTQDKPLTHEEYVKRLLVALSDLNIKLPKHYSETELLNGLKHLAIARVWTLPESALEEISGVQNSIESLRTITEKWAEEFSISEESRAWLIANLKRIQRVASDISDDARIAGEPLSILSKKKQIVNLLRYMEDKFHLFQPGSHSVTALPVALAGAVDAAVKKHTALQKNSESLGHLFRHHPEENAARDALAESVNGLVLAKIRKLRNQDDFGLHTKQLQHCFATTSFGGASARVVWWPLLFDKTIQTFWSGYFRKLLGVAQVDLQSFRGEGSRFPAFFAYAAQALFSKGTIAKARWTPPKRITVGIRSSKYKSTFTATWNCSGSWKEWTFNRAAPTLHRGTEKLEGRLWFLDEIFLRASCSLKRGPTGGNSVVAQIELHHEDRP